MSITTARAAALLAVTSALLLGAFAVAPGANAATIYACARKHGGAVRIVKRSTKCTRAESKLSWNTSGPRGSNGLNGAAGKSGAAGKEGKEGKEGAPGKNGAVAGYSATETSPVTLGALSVPVVHKVLPAGSYLVSAEVNLQAEEAATNGFVEVECELQGKTGSVPVTLDEVEWGTALAESQPGFWEALTNLPLQAAVTLSSPGEVRVLCVVERNLPNAEVFALKARVSAVQTSTNS